MSQLPSNPPDSYFWTPAEAAKFLRISTKFMYDILRGRRGIAIPRFVKIGRNIRIPRDEFVTWTQNQTDTQKPKRKH